MEKWHNWGDDMRNGSVQEEWNTSCVSFFECKHARESVRLLLLTIFLQVRIMSSREESASKDVEAHEALDTALTPPKSLQKRITTKRILLGYTLHTPK